MSLKYLKILSSFLESLMDEVSYAMTFLDFLLIFFKHTKDMSSLVSAL